MKEYKLVSPDIFKSLDDCYRYSIELFNSINQSNINNNEGQDKVFANLQLSSLTNNTLLRSNSVNTIVSTDITDEGLGTINFSANNLTTTGTIDSGEITVTGGDIVIDSDMNELSFGDDQDFAIYHDGSNATLTNITGNITIDTSTFGSGTVDFVAGNLTTTGLGTFGNLDVDTLNLNSNVISDSTGTISLDNDNLLTTGDITGSSLLVDGYITAVTANRWGKLSIEDSDDYIHLSREDANILGFQVDMPMMITEDNLGSDYLDPHPGLLLTNTTPANAITTQQYSPALILSGQGGGANNYNAQWAMHIQPSASSDGSILMWIYKNNTGGWQLAPLSLSTANGMVFNSNGIGETLNSKNALYYANYSSATVSLDQYTPGYRFASQGWKTAATAGSAFMSMTGLNAPEQGVISPIGVHKVFYGISTATALESNELLRYQWGDDVGVLGIIFNDKSLNGYTFRVEGDTDANLINTNGTTDTVCIGGTTTTAKFNVIGTALFTDAIYLTQTDGNEYIDSLADGYLDVGATTAIRLNSPVTRVSGDLYLGSGSASAIVFDDNASDGQISYEDVAGNFIISKSIEVEGKSKLTSIGGFAIKLTNKTGSNTVAGQLVKADTANNDAVILTAAADMECIGVFLDSGIADGSEAWVVISGIADVAMEDNTAATAGNWVEVGNSEAGYANAESASPAAAPRHFDEIGHCIETVSAGGEGTHILARCVIHFN